jgi:hypothetical protein
MRLAFVVDDQVQAELLLRREFAPHAIGPNTTHWHARGPPARGNQPIHIHHRELREQWALPQIDQSKRPAHWPRLLKRAEAGRKAAPLERAFRQQSVGMDLLGRSWRGVDDKHGVETNLAVNRDGDADVGKLAAARYESAIEVLNWVVPDFQVQAELLLHGELAADLVRA